MKFRPIFILFAAFPLAASAAETAAPAAPKPSVMQRLLHPFGGAAESAAPTPPATPAVAKDAGQKSPKVKSSATAAPATPKPGVMQRLLHPFGGPSAPGAPEATKDASLKSLEMGASVEPPAPKLSETREVKVTVTLANKGKKLAQLAFPTNQRIEVLVKDKAGKKLVQWSEDQAFFAEPTLITINPGERLEYAATVSTRDLGAGEAYTVEAFFPSFPELRHTLRLAPEK
jgi:Intracellular proteinase inhibitor